MDYIRAPSEIYAESFRLIRAELGARGHADPDPIAVRMIHACGMADLIDDLVISPDAMAAGRAALAAGAPIFCDAGMVARGIIGRALEGGSAPVVTLDDPRVEGLAAELGTTRSAAAVELWRDRLAGALVAIGNAPTALFHLLDGLAQGWPRPALIVGVPVGFVGAAESKEALIAGAGDIPVVTVRGRRGGSALAAAAVNALTLGLSGDGT